MAQGFELPYPYIFHIIRKGFKPVYKMDTSEFEEFVNVSACLFDQVNFMQYE